MPRSRRFTPSVERDGYWYKMKGSAGEGGIQRIDTVTGAQLREAVTAPLPHISDSFQRRQRINYRLANQFSEHDNRNKTQSFGEYFGNGLGRRQYNESNYPPTMQSNVSQVDPAYWYQSKDGRLDEMTTVQRVDYQDKRPWTVPDFVPAGKPGGQPMLPFGYRRFPQKYKEPDQGPQRLNTAIAYPRSEYKTHLQTLCSSQEPFLRHNAWKYSYYGIKI